VRKGPPGKRRQVEARDAQLAVLARGHRQDGLRLERLVAARVREGGAEAGEGKGGERRAQRCRCSLLLEDARRPPRALPKASGAPRTAPCRAVARAGVAVRGPGDPPAAAARNACTAHLPPMRPSPLAPPAAAAPRAGPGGRGGRRRACAQQRRRRRRRRRNQGMDVRREEVKSRQTTQIAHALADRKSAALPGTQKIYSRSLLTSASSPRIGPSTKL